MGLPDPKTSKATEPGGTGTTRLYVKPERYEDRERCHADRDGDCSHENCPQLRDNEPSTSGRHCPLDTWNDPDEYSAQGHIGPIAKRVNGSGQQRIWLRISRRIVRNEKINTVSFTGYVAPGGVGLHLRDDLGFSEMLSQLSQRIERNETRRRDTVCLK